MSNESLMKMKIIAFRSNVNVATGKNMISKGFHGQFPVLCHYLFSTFWT